jgi:hypothetical protein
VRNKIAVTAMALLLLGGGASAALAAPKKSGLNPPNTYGLCTANHNGKKTGWGPTAPPPFQALQTQGELHETKLQQLLEVENLADARLDIQQACALDGVIPGGQGHGFPLG